MPANPSQSPDVYSSAHFNLELEGVPTSTVRSIEGGTIKTEVITYHANEHKGAIWRQNGKVKYEPIKVVAGLAAGDALYKWMNSFCTGDCERKHGALVAGDYNYNEKARRSFCDAVIECLDFPKFDSNDKNAANVTITIQAETLAYEQPGPGSVMQHDAAQAQQQHIAACNFDFSFDGAPESAVKRVTKVEGFSLKSKTIEYHHAGRLEPIKLGGKIEQPNISFSLPEVDAEYFMTLMKKAATGERPPMTNADVTYFDNSKTPKGKIHFVGCHVFNVQPDKSDAANEDVRLVKVEMAIESLTFTKL
ncbi:MAG: phage tail protein [Myxococcales bacterium]|nr:phage tail protein [Myxococcales bacterium]